VCSANLNSTANTQLTLAGNQSASIESKIKLLAFPATRESPGQLDALGTHRKRMPDALRDIRKHDVGYHRIYYSGHNTNCCYDVCYILVYKKADNEATKDDNESFQNVLIAALGDKATVRVLEDPKEKERKEQEQKEAQTQSESWKQQPWYKNNYGGDADVEDN
jgi:hypothetical protein